MIPVYVLSIIALIVWVLYLHNVLRIARAQTAQYRADYNRLLGKYAERTRELKISETAYEHLDNRYTTMEETFLHNERQLNELIAELRIELDVVKTERDQFGAKLTESEYKLGKLQEELDSVLLHYNP